MYRLLTLNYNDNVGPTAEVRLAVLALIWVTGFLAFWKISLLAPGRKRNENSPGESVSVIIPARNEKHNLTRLLSSLAGQTRPPDEVIVVDDDSSDGTAEVARSFKTRLISPAKKPDGWLGKSWACWQGALAAGGDTLVFLDADTWLASDALASLLGEFRPTGGLLSVQPFHVMKSAYERLSAFFNAILFLNMNISWAFEALNRPRGAFGPCLICRRPEYFSLGGHERTKDRILEDMTLGKSFRDAGSNLRCISGRGKVFFRMYPAGLRYLAEGWTKNFASGAFSSNLPLFLFSFLWVTGCLSGAADLIKGLLAGNPAVFLAGAGLYAAFAAQVHWILRRLGNFGWPTAVFYIIPLIFFILIFFRSLYHTYVLGRVSWKGRIITVRRTKPKS